MPTKTASAVDDSVLAHVSAKEKTALRHLAASRGTTLSKLVRFLIQEAIASERPAAAR